MKYKGKRISGPPLGARTGPKKNSFRGKDPWVISYRTSHERARSANPMRSYSASDSQTNNQTDGQTKRGHKRIENTLKMDFIFLTNDLLEYVIAFISEGKNVRNIKRRINKKPIVFFIVYIYQVYYTLTRGFTRPPDFIFWHVWFTLCSLILTIVLIRADLLRFGGWNFGGGKTYLGVLR